MAGDAEGSGGDGTCRIRVVGGLVGGVKRSGSAFGESLRVTCGGFGAACERRRRFWAARGVEAGHVIHKSRAQRAM